MARLPQGMRRTPNGKIELRFSYDGKRYSVVGIDVQDVLNREREKIAELSANAYVANQNVTVRQYHREYLKRWSSTVKPSTLVQVKMDAQKHFLPALGDLKVKDVEARQIQRFYDSLLDEKGLKPSTAILIMSRVKALFREAVLDKIRIDNPCDRLKYRKDSSPRATETIHRALTVAEQAAFEEAIKGTWLEYFFLFMLHTGCRHGEAGALMWRDIDFVKKEIRISKTLTQVVANQKTNIVIGDTPKTEASKRVLPLTDSVKEILLEQRKRTFEIDGIISLEDVVFKPNRSGEYLTRPSANYAIRVAIRKMSETLGYQVEPFSCHALRDTFATRFLESGGNAKTLQTLLGHSSITMTMDVYAHVLPDTKQSEMDRMEKYLKGGGTV